MEKQYCYKYPHPALTADCVVFGFNGKSLDLLLIERGIEPYKGMWALPGGFMNIDETIEQTARRELREETGLTGIYLEQFKTFSDTGRDPRERVVTVAFVALVRPSDYKLVAGDDAARAHWFDADQLPPLAFDHHRIIAEARGFLKEILRTRPIAFELLNKVFTIAELQAIFECINETTYDRRNFLRTAIEASAIVEASYEELDEADEETAAAAEPSPRFETAEACYSKEVSPVPRSKRAARLYMARPDHTGAEDKPSGKGAKAPTKGLFDFLRWRK